MGYVVLALTVITSILALRFWLRFLNSRVKRLKQPIEVGNLRMDDIGVIGMDRPDPFRTFCNSVVLALCVLMFGIPHFLTIWQFWREPEVNLWHYIHYAWSLIYWLAILGLPAFYIARHHEAQARRLTKRSSIN